MSLDAWMTGGAVGLASLWLVRRLWLAVRARRAGRGCVGGCGCATEKLAGRR